MHLATYPFLFLLYKSFRLPSRFVHNCTIPWLAAAGEHIYTRFVHPILLVPSLYLSRRL
jgi:hypothetical protein